MNQWFIDPNTIYTPFVMAWEKINLRPEQGKSLNEVYRREEQLSQREHIYDLLSAAVLLGTFVLSLFAGIHGQTDVKVGLMTSIPILVSGVVFYLVLDKKSRNTGKECSVLRCVTNTFSRDITALAGNPEDDEVFKYLDEKQVMANLSQKAGLISAAQSQFLEARDDHRVEAWKLKAIIETGMREEQELVKMVAALKPFGITPPERRVLFSQAPPTRIVLKK